MWSCVKYSGTRFFPMKFQVLNFLIDSVLMFLWPITAKISLCKLDTKPPSNTWCCCLQFSLPSYSREHNLCNNFWRSLKNKFRTSTGFLCNCINRVHNCKDHSSFDFISAVLMIYFIYICHKMETVMTM